MTRVKINYNAGIDAGRVQYIEIPHTDKRFIDRKPVIGKDPRINTRIVSKQSKPFQWGLILFILKAGLIVSVLVLVWQLSPLVDQVNQVSAAPIYKVRTKTITEVKEIPQAPKSIAGLIDQTFGPESVNALKVIYCESRFKPGAINHNKSGSQDIGLFQINTIHTTKLLTVDNLKDSAINIKTAKKLFDAQGWNPWYSSRACHGLGK